MLHLVIVSDTALPSPRTRATDTQALLLPTGRDYMDDLHRGREVGGEQIDMSPTGTTVAVYYGGRVNAALLAGVLLACATRQIVPEVYELLSNDRYQRVQPEVR